MGEDKVECIEGVGMFKYLGRLLDWSKNNSPAVHWNISNVRQVWFRLRNVLMEGGGGDFSFRKRLFGSSAGDVTLWGGDLGAFGGNDQRVGGLPHGFLPSGNRKDGEPTVRQDLEQSGSGNCTQAIRDQ